MNHFDKASIPASCPHCGALFASRLIDISGNVQGLTLIGNKETCPFCGDMANTVDGVFNFADDVLSVVSAPEATKQMLAAFEKAIQVAYANETEPEQLAKEVEEIDPSFGDVIRKLGGNKSLYRVALLMLVLAIKSCNLDVTLDTNQLIDQLINKPPTAIIMHSL